MHKYVFPLLVIATMFVADYASAAGNPHGPKSGAMPANSRAVANSNGIRSPDRDRGLARAAERRNIHSVVKTHGHKRHPAKPRVILNR
jgi:hypothetical protein